MDKEEIAKKSEYCLNCKIKPCSNKGCPLNNDIPEFIKCVKENNYEKAYEILTETTVLSSVCGRICPHKRQCQGSCVRGIKSNPVDIGNIEAFVGDYAIEQGLGIKTDVNGKLSQIKVAVIGGGPSGLTCAAFLAKNGIKVTLFEKKNYLGGLLVHGIPEFRLDKKIVKDTVDKILNLGIEVQYNCELGKDIQLNELEKEYDYIYLAVGANITSNMGIDGEEIDGVLNGNEILEFQNHPNYEGKVVAINGGGNVAIDVARTVKKLNAKKVIIIYRRAREQMPADEKEIEEAMNEGIEFMFQNNILNIKGTNRIEKLELVKTELVKKEGEDRLSPVNIEGSNYELEIDYLIKAIGSRTDGVVDKLGIDLTNRKYIKINEKYQTSNPKIYAGGDLTGGKGTVAWAAFDGRRVAEEIINSKM